MLRGDVGGGMRVAAAVGPGGRMADRKGIAEKWLVMSHAVH